jgi:heavy metal translocating P-type ATPase
MCTIRVWSADNDTALMTTRQDRSPSRIPSLVQALLLVFTTSALVAGGAAWLAGSTEIADAFWVTGTVVALGPGLGWVLAGLRGGRVGVDVIAVLSLIGTIVVGEYVAGALIGVMLATGRALDAAASGRAARDLRALLDRAPRTARRLSDSALAVVPLEEVVVGDVLVVGPGETVPVDGLLRAPEAVLDESALTGEAIPVVAMRGQVVRSGAVNAGNAFELCASRIAADSTYAGIVRLAGEAAAEKAPVVRLADRLAAWFLPLTLAVATAAWAASGSLTRAVAVLVVATPCPLLLAAPIAIVSGLSRSSRQGVIIRDGAALENLGHARTLILDKTGTLTTGRPHGVHIDVAPGRDADEILRAAAAADQMSPHVLAEAIVREADRRGLALSVPKDVTEDAGSGVSATVDGHRVSVGSLPTSPTPPWAQATMRRAELEGSIAAWVAIDDHLAGAILFVDQMRSDAPRTIRRLRAAGLNRVVMLTGDRARPAQEVGGAAGLDEVYARQTAADKVSRVRAERQRAVTVMVGDGVNDAPALAAATVGVAMGARGSTASSEAADIVLTADRIDRLADAMDIARWSRHIALQSAATGMALSLLAMGAAAFGYLPPAPGALLQELIDLIVILNALRALGDGRRRSDRLAARTDSLLQQFSSEHEQMRDELAALVTAARHLTAGDQGRAHTSLVGVDTFLSDIVLPHEHAEETELYPALAAPLGGPDATATMSRMHAEIDRLSRRIHAHREVADTHGSILPDQRDDLIETLYGLHELLRLHFAQEEENYFTLAAN